MEVIVVFEIVACLFCIGICLHQVGVRGQRRRQRQLQAASATAQPVHPRQQHYFPPNHVSIDMTGVQNRPMLRQGSMPRACNLCGDLIHPALYDGHVEVCKAQQRQNFERNMREVAENIRQGEGSDSDSSDEEGKCVVCMGLPRSVAFVPCGHWLTCRLCARKLENCPVCREAITQYLYVDGATVNKCKVCHLQIHHTFYTSHREVCRLQMRQREKEKEEEERRKKEAEAEAEAEEGGGGEEGEAQEAEVTEMQERPEDPSAALEEPSEGPAQSTTAVEAAMCSVCLTKPREVAFSPCGHWAACSSCAANMTTCPICSYVVNSVVTIYS